MSNGGGGGLKIVEKVLRIIWIASNNIGQLDYQQPV
jgi:hypothetical protein